MSFQIISSLARWIRARIIIIITFENFRDFFTFLFKVQLGATLFSYLLFYCIFVYCPRRLYKYFKPDYEEAFLYGYTRPIIGLELCERCTNLRCWSRGHRMRHVDDLTQLQASASKGCWLCCRVHSAFSQSQVDRANRPGPDTDEYPRPQPFLQWFAGRTETGNGFLDPLRPEKSILLNQLKETAHQYH
jgi:hypothetical protein